jgi:hypothetical protein
VERIEDSGKLLAFGRGWIDLIQPIYKLCIVWTNRSRLSIPANGEADLLDHLLSKQRRYADRRSSSQEVLPAIKMAHRRLVHRRTRRLDARDHGPRLVGYVARPEKARGAQPRQRVWVVSLAQFSPPVQAHRMRRRASARGDTRCSSTVRSISGPGPRPGDYPTRWPWESGGSPLLDKNTGTNEHHRGLCPKDVWPRRAEQRGQLNETTMSPFGSFFK